MPLPSSQADVSTFSIWRDVEGTIHPHFGPRPHILVDPRQSTRERKTLVPVKRPLATLSNNLLPRVTPAFGKIRLTVRHQNPRGEDAMSDENAIVLPDVGAETIHTNSQSPSRCLPERIQQMFIANSFVTPSVMTTKEKLIATADALDVRSRLMETEVPLSLFPRTVNGIYFDDPLIGSQAVEAKRPTMMNPTETAPRHIPRTLRSASLETKAQMASATAHHEDAFIAPPPIRTMTPMLSLYATVRISNIPWDASTEQIVDFLGKNTRLAPYTSVCSPVHFVLDRTSGKTQSEIYLEIATIGDAERFAQRKTGRSLGSRAANVELVSSKEMLTAIFPRVRNGHWLTCEEIQNVLTHARTFKSPYTRKCPQRPFENFISILCLFPWANMSVYVPSQVNLLYAGYTSLISILQWHIRKGKIPALNPFLLRRLVIAGTNLTNFSIEQKKIVCASIGYYPETSCSTMAFVKTADDLPSKSARAPHMRRQTGQSEKDRALADASESTESGRSLHADAASWLVAQESAIGRNLSSAILSQSRSYERRVHYPKAVSSLPISHFAKSVSDDGVSAPQNDLQERSSPDPVSASAASKSPSRCVTCGPIRPTSNLRPSLETKAVLPRAEPVTNTPTSSSERWLLKAQRAGIAVGLPSVASLPPKPMH